jgi:hypothetical protein
MLQSEFEALKDGDKVVFTGDNEWFDIPKGTILTRGTRWLDDDVTRAFDYDCDWDFFNAEDVDFIKEAQ